MLCIFNVVYLSVTLINSSSIDSIDFNVVYLSVTLINSSSIDSIDVVCRSEFSLKFDETFPDNVKLQNFAKPFLTNKGGG